MGQQISEIYIVRDLNKNGIWIMSMQPCGYSISNCFSKQLGKNLNKKMLQSSR